MSVRSGDVEADRRRAAVEWLREKANTLRMDAVCLEEFYAPRKWPGLVSSGFRKAASLLDEEAQRIEEEGEER